MRLKEKVAIITGAASGIGEGTALLFAEQGARLVLLDRDSSGLETIYNKVVGQTEAVIFCGDVAHSETAQNAIDLALKTFGRLDILFNNAGIMTSGPLTNFEEGMWDEVMNSNLRSMYLLCKAVIPHMLRQGSGAIVNTSSVMATLTEPGYEAYTSSKAGIIGLTKAIAVSYAEQGIRCNCICPGWVDTPMNQRLMEEMGGIDKFYPLIKRQQPNGRMLSTREIAHAVLFLSSDEASGITGTALFVDGGASAAI